VAAKKADTEAEGAQLHRLVTQVTADMYSGTRDYECGRQVAILHLEQPVRFTWLREREIRRELEG